MASDRLETAATAVVLVTLLAVPTASQNIEFEEQRVSETPVISTGTETEIETNIDPEEPSTVEIQKHNTLYTVKETPSERVEKIETPEGTLKQVRNNNSYLSKLSTPYGELVKGMKNGRQVSEFAGANRSKTTEIMSIMTSKVENYREKALQKMLPEIEIKITKSKAADQDERARIENDETESVDITGWTVVNSDGDTYEFDDTEIPARGDLLIYTKEESELNVTENNRTDYIYGTGTDWDADSEKASLFNTEGVKIDEDSY